MPLVSTGWHNHIEYHTCKGMNRRILRQQLATKQVGMSEFGNWVGYPLPMAKPFHCQSTFGILLLSAYCFYDVIQGGLFDIMETMPHNKDDQVF
jgi:hypothetical protein